MVEQLKLLNGQHKDTPVEPSRPIWIKDSLGRNVYEHPLFSFFPEIGTVEMHGESTELTPTENRLLIAFVKNPNKLLGADELISEVWGNEVWDKFNVTHLKDLIAYVYSLRKKIESDYHNPQIIVRIFSKEKKKRGYMLKDESRLDKNEKD